MIANVTLPKVHTHHSYELPSFFSVFVVVFGGAAGYEVGRRLTGKAVDQISKLL